MPADDRWRHRPRTLGQWQLASIAEGELPAFNSSIHRLVLAGRALKGALLRTGSIRLKSSEPHRRAALGARWMHDVLRMRDGLGLAHGDTRFMQAGARRAPAVRDWQVFRMHGARGGARTFDFLRTVAALEFLFEYAYRGYVWILQDNSSRSRSLGSPWSS